MFVLLSSYHPPVLSRVRSVFSSATARAARIALMAGLLAGISVALAACSGRSSDGATSSAGRPTTKAMLRIVSPTPSSVTGAAPNLDLALSHAKIVPGAQAGGKINPTQGHIHVSVDGTLIAMGYTLSEQLPTLAPGPHTVQAEFVAADHLPFANRVVAAVSFTAR
jgi:hypothetical protein